MIEFVDDPPTPQAAAHFVLRHTVATRTNFAIRAAFFFSTYLISLIVIRSRGRATNQAEHKTLPSQRHGPICHHVLCGFHWICTFRPTYQPAIKWLEGSVGSTSVGRCRMHGAGSSLIFFYFFKKPKMTRCADGTKWWNSLPFCVGGVGSAQVKRRP